MRGRPVIYSNGGSRRDAGSPRRDRKGFSRSAGMTNRVNLRALPMRGGIRL